jgi:hypothetical protein
MAAIPCGVIMLARGIQVGEWILIAAGCVVFTWLAATIFLQRREPPA